MRLPDEHIIAPKWETIFTPLAPKHTFSQNPYCGHTAPPETSHLRLLSTNRTEQSRLIENNIVYVASTAVCLCYRH